MLGRLLLILIQLGVGWLLGPMIVKQLPHFGNLTILVHAIAFAIVVWVLGLVGSLVLKDVAQPSPSTLTAALIGALIGAGLTMVPEVAKAVASVIKGGIPTLAYPLIGAVLGYAIKR